MVNCDWRQLAFGVDTWKSKETAHQTLHPHQKQTMREALAVIVNPVDTLLDKTVAEIAGVDTASAHHQINDVPED